MSEINPTDHQSITDFHFPDEGFPGAVLSLTCAMVEAIIQPLRLILWIVKNIEKTWGSKELYDSSYRLDILQIH